MALPILRKEKILIKTFGDERAKLTTWNVVQLCVECADGLIVYIDAYVIPLICSPVTNQCIELAHNNYPHLIVLPLADNSTGETSLKIELLIGADYYYSLVLDQTVRSATGQGPKAIGSYIISGPIEIQNGDNSANMNLNITSTHFMKIESSTVEELHPPNLDFDVSKFWDYESLGIKSEEPPIYESFLKNLEFVQQKYQVSLPFEENHPLIPDNYSLSLQRFHSLIKRLKSKPDILTQYNSVITDQLQNGIIERVPESELNSCKPGGVHYLPHHEVIRSDKKTTHLRIVYDASSKRANEVSLNDCLYRGPPLTPLIFDILVRLRMFRTVLIGDLEKAFLDVRVTPEECDYLRFIWLDDINKDNPRLVIYRFVRLLFGLNSSPLCSMQLLENICLSMQKQIKNLF